MRFTTFFPVALLGCLLYLGTASAAQPQSAVLAPLLSEVLEEHPAVQAAAAALAAAEARSRAAGRPLYNPELELDTEQTGTNASFLGLNQTIDWGDKRGARRNIGGLEVEAARASLALVRQQVIQELLTALNEYHTTGAGTRLARRRVELLEDFLRLAERRFAAGDVGQIDVDLARLTLSEARMTAAGQASQLAAAEADLRALVSAAPVRWPSLPQLPPSLTQDIDGRLLALHPRLRQAQAMARAAGAGVDLARRARRPDPTIGIRGGWDDEDSLLGLTISLPLFVRNKFRAEVDAAAADAQRADGDYRDARRRVRAAMEAAAARYRLTRAALSDWEQGGRASLLGRMDLLRRLWESGEINTTDYLIQLQQTLNTEVAAVELRGAAWEAWLAWLAASGQVEHWITTFEKNHSAEAAAVSGDGE